MLQRDDRRAIRQRAFATAIMPTAANAEWKAEIGDELLYAPMHEHVARSTTGKEHEVVGDPSVGAQSRELLFVNVFDDFNRLMRFVGKRGDDVGVDRILRDFFVVRRHFVKHLAAPSSFHL
jgi:hypothetical protein